MKLPLYPQITGAERDTLARLRQHGYPRAAIARLLGRHRGTISREVRRNATRHDGGYRSELADSYPRTRRARSRRARSRRNQRFARFAAAEWAHVHARLRDLWSPEQIAGRFRHERRLRISHETISRHIWADKRAGGILYTYLYTYLRGGRKQRRKRYGHYDSRGRLAGPVQTGYIGNTLYREHG